MSAVSPPPGHAAPPRRTFDEVAAAGKARDAWWTVVLVEATAIWLVRRLANHTPATPNQLTALSTMLTVASAGGLLEGGRLGLIAGALLFQLSFLVDCMDGRLARLTGTVTELGAWFDTMAGRARFMMCTSALLIGQYVRSEERTYLFLTGLVITCYAVVQITAGHTEQLPAGAGRARAVPHGPWRRLFARPVTEVEFGMVICVIVPQTGAYVPVIAVAAALLLIGELVAVGAAVRLRLRARPGRSPLPVAVTPSWYDGAVDRTFRD
ncbi:MAG: CDP-alcohol phosphatidyltransferase [Actinomycetia bacterium]|nr:CDP-alcohol phosphatidyltransferase [Actinomycetes bacterium]